MHMRFSAKMWLFLAVLASCGIDRLVGEEPVVSLKPQLTISPLDVERVNSLPGKIMLAGGTFIDAMGEEFTRLAGGADARIVIIPTAYGPTEEEGIQQFIDQWNAWKPACVEVMHTRDRKVADDPAFVAPLTKATGVWFTGGKQHRLIETYGGTAVEKELHAMLKRGAAVGGNCAGAMALGEQTIVRNGDDYLVRKGFCIIPKVIVDSHFLERNRIERLRGFVESKPDHFGLGIDSRTAVILEKGQLRVLGMSYAMTMIAGARMRMESFDPGDEIALRPLFQQ